jgi:hypothetical protein
MPRSPKFKYRNCTRQVPQHNRWRIVPVEPRPNPHRFMHMETLIYGLVTVIVAAAFTGGLLLLLV